MWFWKSVAKSDSSILDVIDIHPSMFSESFYHISKTVLTKIIGEYWNQDTNSWTKGGGGGLYSLTDENLNFK